MEKFKRFEKNPFVNNIPASIRVMIIGGVLLVGFGFAVFLFTEAFTEDLYDAKRQGLVNVVSLARNAMEPIIRDKQNGKITLAQARLRMTEAVGRFVYSDHNGANFLFLATYEGYILVEPSAPDEVGTYQMQRRDKEGVPLIQAFLKKAKSGGGFVVSTEARIVGEAPQKKISYVIGIPEIECYLGTGIFVNELDEAVNKLMIELLTLGLAIFAIVFLLQYYLMKPLLRNVQVMSECFKRLSEDPTSLKTLGVDLSPSDPDGRKLMKSFGVMLSRLQTHQDEIVQQAENHKLIAHATNDIIWQWEASTGKTRWSKNIRQIIGVLPEMDEVHFEVDEGWIHPDDRAQRRQILAAYFAGSSDLYICDYRMLSGDGSYRWVRARGLATFDNNGAPIRMVGSMIDLDEIVCRDDLPDGKQRDAVADLIPQNLAGVVQKSPAVPCGALVIDVKNRLDIEKWQGIVVLEQEAPVGLVMKHALNHQLSSQYGVSLYYGRSVELVMDGSPLIVDAGLSLENVAALANQRPEEKLYDLIVVTSEGKYQGTVSIMDLLRQLSNLRIQLAMNANPLTGLPGNRVIDEKIQFAVRQNRPFAAMYIDLDNFKAFNDKYGFERGDTVIQLTANILKHNAAEHGGQDAFVGHIGGDDFIVLLFESAQYGMVAEHIIKEFDEKIRSLYVAEDLAQGYIVVASRKKSLELYPIMSISIAVVDSCCHPIKNYLEVAELAAELKHRAKSIEGSVWVQERRNAAQAVKIS
jgi:diguanylate cyclase (GGDEF)-like protein